MKLGTQSVITYKGANKQRIYAFVTDSGGHLQVNYWNGSQWQWNDQGKPPNTTAAGAPGVVTYRERTNPQQIYAFVRGANGHLYMNFWNGSQWQWADQGKPAGTTVDDTPGIVTYREGANPQRIYVFVRGANGHLYVNYSDGAQWQWADQGKPLGTTVAGAPGVITYRQGTKPQRIYAFARGANGHLYVNFWDGSQWQWADRGTPQATTVSDDPGVISYHEGTKPQRIFAFVRGGDGHLHVNYWDGSQWQWADQGEPILQGVAPGTVPGIATYAEGGKQRIYAFVTRKPSDVAPATLNIRWWDGFQWHWSDQGGDVGPAPLGAVSYKEAGQRRIYAFMPDVYAGQPALGVHLVVHYYNGSEWKWADQGKL